MGEHNKGTKSSVPSKALHLLPRGGEVGHGGRTDLTHFQGSWEPRARGSLAAFSVLLVWSLPSSGPPTCQSIQAISGFFRQVRKEICTPHPPNGPMGGSHPTHRAAGICAGQGLVLRAQFPSTPASSPSSCHHKQSLCLQPTASLAPREKVLMRAQGRTVSACLSQFAPSAGDRRT